MKKIKKIISVLLLIMLAVMTTGCAKSASPEESGLMMFDLYMKGDISKLNELGVKGEDLDTVVDEYQRVFKESMMAEFNDVQTGDFSYSISDAEAESITVALRNVINKLECSVEVISEEKDTAELNIKTNYIEFFNIVEESANTSAEQFIKDNSSADIEYITSDQFLNDFMKFYLNKVVETISTYEPTIATRSENFKFKKEYVHGGDNNSVKLWIPEDESEFADKLSKLILGM